jgi:hypothetical protein
VRDQLSDEAHDGLILPSTSDTSMYNNAPEGGASPDRVAYSIALRKREETDCGASGLEGDPGTAAPSSSPTPMTRVAGARANIREHRECS